MGTPILDMVRDGRQDRNIRFADLCTLLETLGFTERIRGDHHIFAKEGIAEIINLQPDGSKAKPYQVKQVRGIINRYHLEVRQHG